MKKIIQILLIIILTAIVALIIVFVFNPFNLRTKLVSSIINNYLSSTIENYSSLGGRIDNSGSATGENGEPLADKNPLLNEDQEKMLESYGVDVSRLPASISTGMKACFIEKLGQARADEIVGGASPNAIEILRTKSCLGQ